MVDLPLTVALVLSAVPLNAPRTSMMSWSDDVPGTKIALPGQELTSRGVSYPDQSGITNPTVDSASHIIRASARAAVWLKPPTSSNESRRTRRSDLATGRASRTG